MSTYRVFSLRSYGHQAYIIQHAVNQETDPERRTSIQEKMTYEARAIIWQLPHRDARGHYGSIVERTYSGGHAAEMGIVGRRLLDLPELVAYQLQVKVARVHSRFLEYDPPYEKLLVVTTDRHLATLPRPRLPLPVFSNGTMNAVEVFAHQYLQPFVNSECIPLDYHTSFGPMDVAATTVASPSSALLGYAVEYGCSDQDDVWKAVLGACEARLESGDEDNYNLLAHVAHANAEKAFPRIEPMDILGAYVSLHYAPPIESTTFVNNESHMRFSLMLDAPQDGVEDNSSEHEPLAG